MADTKNYGNVKTPLKTQQTGSLDMASVYNELRDGLTRFAYRYFKTPQEIEDVVQEAFVKVIEAQDRREIAHPKAYMYQTVKNLSLKRLDTSDYRLTDSVGELLPDSVLIETATLEEQFESKLCSQPSGVMTLLV